VLRRLRARRQGRAFLSTLSIGLRISHGTEPKMGRTTEERQTRRFVPDSRDLAVVLGGLW
jgi:hypothetical protein